MVNGGSDRGFDGFAGFMGVGGGVFEGKGREFDEMSSFLGGSKKGGKGGYRGLKKSSGEMFLKRL